MKNQEQIIKSHLDQIPTFDLELYIELGEKERKKGNNDRSIFWFRRGFEMSKQLKDRARIQQFSNILYSLI
jgi:hypothetical protein